MFSVLGFASKTPLMWIVDRQTRTAFLFPAIARSGFYLAFEFMGSEIFTRMDGYGLDCFDSAHIIPFD
jgi:hypothetical protein